MKFKAVIFDMDGTITDSEIVWQQASKAIIEKRRPTISPFKKHEIIEHLVGMGVPDACAYIKEALNLEEPLENLIREKTTLAHNLYENSITFIQGFKEFHKEVKTHGLKHGVATNAIDQTIERTKRALPIESFFGHHIYGISRVNFRSKPDPAIYLYAAKQLGIDPRECIAIEDSSHGIIAAQAAGMMCIGINTGNNRARIQHAHVVVESYQEIRLGEILQAELFIL